MTFEDFVKAFSHNNEMIVINRNGTFMKCLVGTKGYEETIMDWYIPMSSIRGVEVISLCSVLEQSNIKSSAIHIKVDTEDEEFHIVPELAQNPLWIYNATHPDSTRNGCECCCGG